MDKRKPAFQDFYLSLNLFLIPDLISIISSYIFQATVYSDSQSSEGSSIVVTRISLPIRGAVRTACSCISTWRLRGMQYVQQIDLVPELNFVVVMGLAWTGVCRQPKTTLEIWSREGKFIDWFQIPGQFKHFAIYEKILYGYGFAYGSLNPVDFQFDLTPLFANHVIRRTYRLPQIHSSGIVNLFLAGSGRWAVQFSDVEETLELKDLDAKKEIYTMFASSQLIYTVSAAPAASAARHVRVGAFRRADGWPAPDFEEQIVTLEVTWEPIHFLCRGDFLYLSFGYQLFIFDAKYGSQVMVHPLSNRDFAIE